MNAAASILVLEDEANVAMTLVERLRRDGYHVELARSIAEAKIALTNHRFDLALLDVGLPDGSGFEIGAELRQKQTGCAVIFLTAYADPDDRVRGLELGAEDYVAKPFHLRELLLRIQNVLRRVAYIHQQGAIGAAIDMTLGRAILHLARFEIQVDGVVHPLTHKECALMKFLLERRGEVVSRDEILNFVWSADEYPTPRTVDNFIMRLRRLIERDPNHPDLIRSVRGVGYQLV
jgi:two-component system alkaline phosphatase synthesis response regulator PhoP